tara:strand:+ start:974 stop:1195 length:222 start_codon:yes stop_codon:yes gene_type:complete
MLLSIDALGKRYSLLPSEVMEKASTFDLVVLDAALGYQTYIQDQADGKKATPKLSQEEMMAAMERVRKDDNNT